MLVEPEQTLNGRHVIMSKNGSAEERRSRTIANVLPPALHTTTNARKTTLSQSKKSTNGVGSLKPFLAGGASSLTKGPVNRKNGSVLELKKNNNNYPTKIPMLNSQIHSKIMKNTKFTDQSKATSIPPHGNEGLPTNISHIKSKINKENNPNTSNVVHRNPVKLDNGAASKPSGLRKPIHTFQNFMQHKRINNNKSSNDNIAISSSYSSYSSSSLSLSSSSSSSSFSATSSLTVSSSSSSSSPTITTSSCTDIIVDHKTETIHVSENEFNVENEVFWGTVFQLLF